MALVPKCCWCGERLRKFRYKYAEVWGCPTDACWQRQEAQAITVQARDERRKEGLTRPKCIYLPLPRQTELIEAVDAGHRRILMGGAAGGAKSHSLRWLHYRQALKFPGFVGLILRRKFPELEMTHIRAAQVEASKLGGQYFATKKIIQWDNGSITQFGHCQEPDDVANYLSAEFDLISFDEIVTFERDQVLMISSRARSTMAGVTPQVVSGTNPGGPNANWVKEWYIDKLVDRLEYPDYHPEHYVFIPSRLEDNPYLGPEYEATLLELPPLLRKAYRDGSWDIWPGQFFPEWDRTTHVREWPDFDPQGCRVVCGVDWGYMQPGVALWAAVTPEGRLYVFDEYVFKMTITAEVAAEIRARNKAWKAKPLTVADTQMWGGQDQTGEHMAETFARCGVPLVQAQKDRVNGWARVRAWLRPAPDGRPWVEVHPRCNYLIRTLPQMQMLARQPDDVDDTHNAESHACDALRYLLMARPAPGRTTKQTVYPPNSMGGMLQRESARERKGRLRRQRRRAA